MSGIQPVLQVLVQLVRLLENEEINSMSFNVNVFLLLVL